MFPADLPDEWRALALQQRDLGAEPQARTLEWCADRLEEAVAQSLLEQLRARG